MNHRPPFTPRIIFGTVLFLAWLIGGYTVLLLLALKLPVLTALWQAALCLLAIPVLLLVVVKFVALPKYFIHLLPRPLLEFLWFLGSLSEVVLPWLGWSALLAVVNSHRGASSLWTGAGIGGFSYLTGFLILFLFHPRPRSVRFTTFELPLPGLPPAFDGYRLLHLSDLHVGAYNSPAQARARLARAYDTDADLIAFTGDLTDNRECIPEAVALLASLSARDGAVQVMGNHDNWQGPSEVLAVLRRHGLTPLVNDHLTLRRGESLLHIVGVDNPAYGERDNLAAALEGVGEGETVILLSHAPEIILRPLAARAALILCGHTHGGQIVLPLIGPFYVPSKLGRAYASGLFPHGRGWLFINRGLGEIFPPLRVLCPPEIVLITLRSAPSN